MLELFQEGIAAVEQCLELPTDLPPFLIESAVPVIFKGHQFTCLIQQLKVRRIQCLVQPFLGNSTNPHPCPRRYSCTGAKDWH